MHDAGVAAIMPVDQPEEDWADLQIVFATSEGDVRRNALSDFTNVMRNGKIAMKLAGEDKDATLVNARICAESDDVMLVTATGRAIRFPHYCRACLHRRVHRPACGVSELAEGDKVVSMAVIRHFEATTEERAAYLKMRRAVAGQVDRRCRADTDEEAVADVALSQERYAEMSAAEHLILTITATGRRQAVVQPRLPCTGPWRSRRSGDGQSDARRAAGCVLPG